MFFKKKVGWCRASPPPDLHVMRARRLSLLPSHPFLAPLTHIRQSENFPHLSQPPTCFFFLASPDEGGAPPQYVSSLSLCTSGTISQGCFSPGYGDRGAASIPSCSSILVVVLPYTTTTIAKEVWQGQGRITHVKRVSSQLQLVLKIWIVFMI